MATFSLSTSQQLTLCYIISYLVCINSQITYISQHCSEEYISYDTETDYTTYMNGIISRYTNEASKTHFGTNTTSIGLDKVNTLFNCRYDVPHRTCQRCVASVANNISSCLSSVEGFIIYEECTFVYSNRAISSTNIDEMVQFYQYSPVSRQHNYMQKVLNDTVAVLIRNTIDEFEVSSRYFAMSVAKNWSTIYALAQCNPDISSSNCSLCLRLGYRELSNTTGADYYGQYFSPLCRLSYISSEEELSRPWKFFRTYKQSIETYFTSAGTRGSSIASAMLATISSLVLCLKLLLY